MTIDLAALRHATDEYAAAIARVTALYLDSNQGFANNTARLDEGQRQALVGLRKSDPSHATRAHVDSLDYLYGKGDPSDPSNVLLHWSTQGQFRARNEVHGSNRRLIGQLCLVLTFEYWEGEYRQRIAEALGRPRKELTEPILGDLRLIRNDVVHHRGILTERTARRLLVIEGLDIGDEVSFDDEAFHSIIHDIRAFLDRLILEATGVDPEYRALHHIE